MGEDRVLQERGWKTEQGPTPNSGVNTLKNRPGGSFPRRTWGDPPLPGLGGGWSPSPRKGGPHHRGGGRRSTHVAGQTSRHTVRYRGDGASDGVGRCQRRGAAPGAAFPDMEQGASPRHGRAARLRARPTAGRPGRAQPALPGWFDMERERKRKRETGRDRPVLPPRLLWHVTGRG